MNNLQYVDTAVTYVSICILRLLIPEYSYSTHATENGIIHWPERPYFW